MLPSTTAVIVGDQGMPVVSISAQNFNSTDLFTLFIDEFDASMILCFSLMTSALFLLLLVGSCTANAEDAHRHDEGPLL